MNYCRSCKSKRKKAHRQTSFFVLLTLNDIKILPNFALVARACIAVAGHGSMNAPVQLIVATRVAIVDVMTVVLSLVVVCTRFLIAWAGTALFVQVLGVLAVNATGLEVLFFAFRGTLSVVVFVLVVTAVIAELALLALAMLTSMVATVALIVQPVAPTLVREKALLTRISFLQLAAKLTFCFRPNLFDLMAHQASIIFMSLVNQLKVLWNGLKRLIA